MSTIFEISIVVIKLSSRNLGFLFCYKFHIIMRLTPLLFKMFHLYTIICDYKIVYIMFNPNFYNLTLDNLTLISLFNNYYKNQYNNTN